MCKRNGQASQWASRLVGREPVSELRGEETQTLGTRDQEGGLLGSGGQAGLGPAMLGPLPRDSPEALPAFPPFPAPVSQACPAPNPRGWSWSLRSHSPSQEPEGLISDALQLSGLIAWLVLALGTSPRSLALSSTNPERRPFHCSVPWSWGAACSAALHQPQSCDSVLGKEESFGDRAFRLDWAEGGWGRVCPPSAPVVAGGRRRAHPESEQGRRWVSEPQAPTSPLLCATHRVPRSSHGLTSSSTLQAVISLTALSPFCKDVQHRD